MWHYSWQLLSDLFKRLPLRIWRFFNYLFDGLKDLSFRRENVRAIPWWWLGLFLMFLEIFGIVELYEWLSGILKTRTRSLSPQELLLAESVFEKAIDYKRVRIDEGARLGPKQYQFCYVSFHTINSWGPMREDVFIHELVHVWQYQQLGATYISKALMAQWGAGYDYGGLSVLKKVKEKGGGLLNFNFEQQADIIMDYYRLSIGLKTRWGNATAKDIIYYQYYLDELRSSQFKTILG